MKPAVPLNSSFCHIKVHGKPRSPLWTIQEVAGKLGVDALVLQGAMGYDTSKGRPVPTAFMRTSARMNTGSKNYYKPAEMLRWWKERAK